MPADHAPSAGRVQTGPARRPIGEFAGLPDPCEALDDTGITLDPAGLTVEEAAQKIILFLEKEGYGSGEPADRRS